MITGLLDRIIFFCLCALMVVLPVTIAGVQIFSSVAACLFLVKKTMEFMGKEKAPARVPVEIFIPAMVFLAVCLVSVFWSEVPRLSARAFVGKSLLAVVTFLSVVATVNTPRRLAWLTGSFLGSAFLLSLDGLWQLWKGADVLINMTLLEGRVRSVMKHPNDLGAYLIIAIFLGLALVLWSWAKNVVKDRLQGWRLQVLLIIVLFVLCTAMGLTYSRGAWLGCFFALLTFVVIRREYILACVGLGLVFAVIFSPLMTSARNVSFVSDNVVGGQASADHASQALPMEFSGSDRLNLWKDAFKIIHDHPVMGTGLNTYTVEIYKYSQHRKLYPHNSYLQMWAELGIIGLGSFLWLLWSVGRFAFKRIVVHKDGAISLLLTALFAAWIGLLLESGLDTTFFSVQLSRLLWVVMGSLVAGAMILEKKASS